MQKEEENNILRNRISSLEADLDEMRTRVNCLQSAILSNISHDIRTPMNAIVGFANLLMAEKLDDNERDECIRQINSNSIDLLEIVDNMIDASLLQSGDMKLSPRECCLNDLMDDLYSMCRDLSSARQKQLNIIVTKGGDNGCFVMADHRRLKQVLWNLIGNAVKYTERGHVEFGYMVTDNIDAEFFVKDTGIGLSTHDEEVLFTPFRSKLTGKKGTNAKGAGLGLAVSKNLVELMGGRMWHESSPGKGTCFYFSLPGKRTSYLKRKLDQINTVAKRSIASIF